MDVVIKRRQKDRYTLVPIFFDLRLLFFVFIVAICLFSNFQQRFGQCF